MCVCCHAESQFLSSIPNDSELSVTVLLHTRIMRFATVKNCLMRDGGHDVRSDIVQVPVLVHLECLLPCAPFAEIQQTNAAVCMDRR